MHRRWIAAPVLGALLALVMSGCMPLPIPSPAGMTSQPLSPSTEAATPLSSVFTQMPSLFGFESGAGAWSTGILIAADGSFTGSYHDADMGDTGPGYPNGTAYEAIFSGRFVVTEKVSKLEYRLHLASLQQQGHKGDERIEGGVRIITADPYGFENAGDFSLYLPGRATADLPAEFLYWASMENVWPTVPATLPGWGLYNIGGQKGFWGHPAEPAPSPATSDGAVTHEYVLIHTDFGPSDPVGQAPGNNFVGAYIASVKIIVQGSQVAAIPCGSQEPVADPATCNGFFSKVDANSPQSDSVWRGTRQGTSAIVSGTNPFLWATITFADATDSARAVRFDMGRDCVDVHGKQGKLDMPYGCVPA